MDVRERIKLIVVTSFFIGLIVLLFIGLTIIIVYSHYNLSIVLPNPYFYLYLELLFLAITWFFSFYFNLRPVSTLKGRNNLAIGVMSFGGVLLVFPLIGIGLMLFGLPYIILEGFLIFWLIGLIPLLVGLIPGVPLFMHGWYLRKNLRSETIS